MSLEDDRHEAEKLQLAVVEHGGSAYVEACPGAGKTRTLVRRIERLSTLAVPRRGAAMLSFTNAAVDEFKKRCHSQGILERLGFPNFIGTFDGFLNHFLVMPLGIPGCPRRPVIVDSWNHVEVSPGLRGVQARPISLSRFDAETGSIDLSSIRDRRILPLVQQHKQAYEDSARRRRRALNAQGYLCADDARLVAKRILSDKQKADAIGQALAARFSEVIVDEAQDCNADDVLVLEWLKRHGVPLVLVCDPDQAIFEFRKGTNGSFRTFVQSYPKLELKGNFRSSSVICAATGSMRTRISADFAVGQHHNEPHPIILIPYGNTAKPEVGKKFKALTDALGINDCIVLAHKRRLSEQASGSPPRPSSSGGKLPRLARLIVAFQAPLTDGKHREATLKSMIRLLMELEEQHDDEVASLQPLADSPEIDRMYRRKALEVLAGLPSTYKKIGIEGWADQARTLVAKMVVLPEGKTIKQALRTSKNWHLELELPPATDLPCATIHEAKGRDFEGVCLVLEKESEGAVTDWENRATATSEALRVLYVGATRAKKFLAIALPTELLAKVETILAGSGVPFRKEEPTSIPPKVRGDPGKSRPAGLSHAKTTK
jgi:hypothetical protein